jgi:2-keto-4-pentenoate hydratase/2-oxohepta-3-ene-1,7-dioic acid hydratase in catechol pathway
VKFLRYQSANGPAYGILGDDGTVRAASGSPLGEYTVGDAVGSIDSLKLLTPVDPGKIICVGQNYLLHIQETGAKTPEFPMLFMKPRTTLVANGDPVVYPKISQMVHYEGELVVVIGKKARWVDEANSLDYIAGYTCANDISARDWQRREMANGFILWGKGFDTFCPLGPVVNTDLDPTKLTITTRVNGEVKQHSTTGDLLFSVAHLVADISRAITLEPGDVILTGTPSGVGPIAPGDQMEVEIEGIGILRNPVVAEA